MTCEGRISHRQTFPVDHGNGGKIHNPADTLSVAKKPLPKLETFIMSQRSGLRCGERSDVRPCKKIVDGGNFTCDVSTLESVVYANEAKKGHQRVLRGFLVSPLSVLPLVPIFRTSYGGGRIGGGGTSKEALRRAKRKARLAK